MIKSVELGKEIVITVANKVGILANISKILADHGVNLEGIAGYTVDDEAKIMLVADDELRAKEALQKAGYKSIKEKEVIVVDLI
ncbi:MAG: ACT domain-containing protein, partial [Candidatus Omnitrophota bacterium]